MPRETPPPRPTANTETAYRALDRKKEEEILAAFTPEEQAEIREKQHILSSLAYFIGKDFRIPVELNDPGAGWHWDFEHNVIRIDPKDLLEKPMDYLRFVISHEGGHRRISRTDFIPLDEWRQPGFSFMMNAIEDPRDNNFVAESYPEFRRQMALVYQQDLDFEGKAKEKAAQKLGYQPRFMQAGFEYIKQWFRETEGKEIAWSDGLPEDVKAVVAATLESAMDSWLRYPSRAEADTSEELIRTYARVSYEINRDEVWPAFKTLVEADMVEQNMQEFLKGMQRDQEQKGSEGLPQELKDTLTPEEQQALTETMEKAGTDGTPIDLDSLPNKLKQKIKAFIDALPDKDRKKIEEQSRAAIKAFEDALNDELQGKLSDNPEKKMERGEGDKKGEETKTGMPKASKDVNGRKEDEKDQEKRRKRMEAVFETKKKHPYEKVVEDMSDQIDSLTADLRDVFVRRKKEKYNAGHRGGRRWNVRQRIREMVARIPLFKTEAREQRESESEEMDYAITLMVDLSGSMGQNRKIQEAFKATAILAETLTNLGIRFEIVGFQDTLLEFKSFDEQLDDTMRAKMNQMPLEVSDSNPGGHNHAGDNDDGACLLEASRHLSEQSAKNKFLIVISDGMPAMDSRKKSSDQLDRELKDAVAEIAANTNQKLVGIGLMSAAVAKYYEHHIANVSAKEMTEVLGGLLREIIETF